MRVLSLGAGVQSTTILRMSIDGELPPLDAAVFADTQRESAEVYAHLRQLETECERAGIAFRCVSKGDLMDALDQVPTYKDGGRGSKFCSGNYKRNVVIGEVSRMRAPGEAVEMVFGISVDEHHRMRRARASYVTNVYPLVDLRMTRWDCHRWHAVHRLPQPPRSSCVFCPYRTNREWRHLRDTDPAGWAIAIEADARADGFVHRSEVPLAEADIDDDTQPSLWSEECEGMCGV